MVKTCQRQRQRRLLVAGQPVRDAGPRATWRWRCRTTQLSMIPDSAAGRMELCPKAALAGAWPADGNSCSEDEAGAKQRLLPSYQLVYNSRGITDKFSSVVQFHRSTIQYQ